MLGLDGRPLPQAKVAVSARSRQWTATRKRLVGGFYAYDQQVSRRDLGAVCEGSTDARGLLAAQAPARFGMVLIALGILLMALGIANHYRYMQTLRGMREDFKRRGFLQGGDGFPVSLTLIVSFLMVLLGLWALLSIGLRAVAGGVL